MIVDQDEFSVPGLRMFHAGTGEPITYVNYLDTDRGVYHTCKGVAGEMLSDEATGEILYRVVHAPMRLEFPSPLMKAVAEFGDATYRGDEAGKLAARDACNAAVGR